MDNSNTLPTIRGICQSCGGRLLYYYDNKGNYLFTGEKNTALGCHADVIDSKSRCVVVGCGSHSKHDNAVVIGTDKVSHEDDSITLGNLVITKDRIILNEDSAIIIDTCDTHCDRDRKCFLCDEIVSSGLLNSIQGCNEEVLCFSCIFSTVKSYHIRITGKLG